jgi:hypothetical protein
MIDPKKKYTTRDGREVRIYAVDGEANQIEHPIHGAFKNDRGGWVQQGWFRDGKKYIAHENDLDLIKVDESFEKAPEFVWCKFASGNHPNLPCVGVGDENENNDPAYIKYQKVKS